MKIITRAVLDWNGNVIEEDSYEYSGPISACKDSGSSPQPTDPYEQAAAQYGLSTGTANYNAALNRTNSVNPLGSSSWSVTGQDGSGVGSFGGYPTGFNDQNESGSISAGGGMYLPGDYFGSSGIGFPSASASSPTSSATNGGSGAPIYTQSTSLAPWANQQLESPINSYNVVGDQGVGAAAQQAQEAAYNQQMAYLQPQEAQQSEQTQAQLEAEGAMPGSAAYGYGEQQLGQQQTFANQQAADAGVQAGQSSLANLAGIGSTELQNELATRNAPISEYESLLTGNATPVSASTPDISGAFGQQYQGALAGYNANVATNNANTSAGAGLSAAALEAYAAYAGASF